MTNKKCVLINDRCDDLSAEGYAALGVLLEMMWGIQTMGARMSAPDLGKRIKEAQEKAKGNGSVSLPRYEYPPEVLTSSMLGYLSTHGVEFKVMRDEVSPVPLSALASQKAVGKAIFGKGWLISEKKAAEKIIVWELSEAEREAVRRISLDKKNV